MEPRSSVRTVPDRGAVTVEAALGVVSITAVLGLVLSAGGIVLGQIRCTDAAIEAARLTARGEQHRAPSAVARLAPPRARLSVRVHGDEIVTVVTAPTFGFVAYPLRGSAFAVAEPGVAGGEEHRP